MKFSTKTRYGIRTMLEIALHSEEQGVFQKDIADNQDISIKYLDHIIHALKVAGLITTLKGKKSGYILTRPSSEISMLDIHNAFEPGISVVDCLTRKTGCHRSSHCAAKGFWEDLNHQLISYFSGISLEDLANKQEEFDRKG